MQAEVGTTTKRQSLLSPEVRANPYPLYHRLRSEDPVHRSQSWGGWLLTRYSDVVSGLRDSRLSPGGVVAPIFDRLPAEVQEELMPLRRHLSMWMGNLDPPEHTRLRSVMQRAFAPRLLEALRPFTQETADELIDAVESSGEMDVVRDFADHIPAVVIAKLLGTPIEDHALFKRWSDELTEFIGYALMRVDVVRMAQNTVFEMTDYLRALTAKKRRSGKGRTDLIGSLMAVRKGEKLSEAEMFANCVLLLFAGHQTTTIFIGNSILALLNHPDQMHRLRNDPSLMASALRELLRYDSPVQMVRRSAKEDLTIGGKQIKQGEVVWLVVGAANRDPDHFPDPDRLDIARNDSRHVAFGLGIHYCLGAALSMIEGEIAVGTILRRLLGLRQKQTSPEWLDNPTARALKSLPVVFQTRNGTSS